ncbi:MAG: hypothetical protein IIW52_03105 [Alistipes sp.]|nr:hypothetical protein [Alistipes sp.]
MKYFLFIIFTTILLFSGCYNGKFKEPQIVLEQSDVNSTISQLYDMCKHGGLVINSDIAIKGIVISSDKDGYISNALFIDDGQAAAQICLNLNCIYSLYPIGSEVIVSLNGLCIEIKNDILLIGAPKYIYDSYRMENIKSETFISKHIIRTNVTQPTYPLNLSISQLTHSLCGRLITLEQMHHFAKSSEESIYAGGYHRFVDYFGGQIFLYIAPDARGYGNRLPQGEVSITGILSYKEGIHSSEDSFVITPIHESHYNN